MKENNIKKAGEHINAALGFLEIALSEGSSVESIIILGLMGDVVKLRDRNAQLLTAMQVDAGES